jgi:hypothetical protein
MKNKPVAWMYEDASGTMKLLGNTRLEEWVTKFGCKEIPPYTHPAKTLTDEEIEEIWANAEYMIDYNPDNAIRFARAILKKAQEKC